METLSALLAICAGNSPVTGEFPAQRPVTRSFDVFFDLRLNKWLSNQSWGWWFETLSRPLWRHCNVLGDFKVKLPYSYIELLVPFIGPMFQNKEPSLVQFEGIDTLVNKWTIKFLKKKKKAETTFMEYDLY